MEKTLPIGVFKTQCYQLCQDVAEKDLQLIVTRHGKPLIRVMPFATFSQGTFNGHRQLNWLKVNMFQRF